MVESGFLQGDTPPQSHDDVKEFLALRMQAFGYDEKDRQYRLKWCDGSVEKYVEKIWGEVENNKIITAVLAQHQERNSSNQSGPPSSA